MIKIGQRAQISKVIREADIESFAEISGDDNPLHMDEAYAAQSRFGARIAHGMLAAGLISAVLGTRLPGTGCIYLGQELKFKAPVYIGDEITAKVEVTAMRTDKPIVTLSTNCYNQEGAVVIEGTATMLYPKSTE